jgi:ribosomal-protein-serine acetyltransferase
LAQECPRPWRVEDAEALSVAVEASLDELRLWMPWAAEEPRTLVERRAWIEEVANDAVGIVAADDRTALGGTGLHRRIGEGGVEIGYWVRTSHTGQGIATKVSAALTRYAFESPEIDRVEIHCDEANVASASIPRKLGFTLISIEPDGIAAPGESGRSMTWRLTRDQLDESSVSHHPAASWSVSDHLRPGDPA